MSEQSLSSLLVVLNQDGVIKAIKKNMEPALDINVGDNIIKIVDPAHTSTYMNQLKQIQDVGYAFNPSLSILKNKHSVPVYAGMIAHKQDLLFFMLDKEKETAEILNEVIRINNEQIMTLRKASAETHYENKEDMASLDTISALNSQLVNTQRRLEQKNIELMTVNRTLNKMSHHDFLTKVPNRRKFFNDIYNKVLETSLDLIMLDINSFKTINDEMGHKKGDEVLVLFAEALAELAKAHDGDVYRLGGDEFALLIPKTSHLKFKHHVEHFDKTLKAIHPVLSIAYGVETVNKRNVNENNRAEEVMSKADSQMYVHKEKHKRS